MNKRFLFFFLLALCFQINAQFDYQTSTVSESLLSVNPAVAGSDEDINLTFIHKKKWASNDVSPVVQELSFHAPFNHNRIGLGGVVSRNKLSVENNLRVMLSATYKIHLNNNNYLSFGLGAGNWFSKRDFSDLEIEDYMDVNFTNNESLNVFDTWLGLYLKGEKISAGFSITHLNKISLNAVLRDEIGGGITYQKNPVFSIHGSYKKKINQRYSVTPFLMVRKADYNNLKMYYLCNLKVAYKESLFFGPQFRNNAVGVNMGVALNKYVQSIKNDFKVYYSSEVNYRALNPGLLSHEVLLTYAFKRHKKIDKIKDQDVTVNPKGY